MKFLSAAVASLGGSLAAAAAITAGQTPLANNELAVPGDNPLTFCEKPDGDILTITNVDLEPNPPKKGQDLLITATGTLSEAVEEGSYVLLQVKFGLIKLVNLNESLCEQLKKVDRDCPLEKGELTFQRTVTLPNEIPPGKFNVFADVYSKDGRRITCMEAKDISFYQSSGDYIKGMLEL